MTVEEYLKTTKAINLTEVARLMYPNNKSAGAKLLTKLSEKSPRTFNAEDEKLALDALRKIGATLKDIDGM